MKSFLTVFVLIIFGVSNLFAQQVAIGEWQSFLPFKDGGDIMQSESSIYYKTRYSIAVVDKAEESIRILDNVNTLNDGRLSRLAYNENFDAIIVSYENSNIDMVYPNEVVNFNSIETNFDIFGSKEIYGIYTADSLAVLACGFGLVQLNLSSQESDFTTFITDGIEQAAFIGDDFYVLYEGAIFELNQKQKNILDFQEWESLDIGGILVDDFYINGESIIIKSGNEFYTYSNGQLNLIYTVDSSLSIDFVKVENNKILIALTNQSFLILDIDGNIENELAGDCFNGIEDAILVAGKIWMSTFTTMNTFDISTNSCEKYQPNGPSDENATDIKIVDDEIFIAFGRVSSAWQPIANSNGAAVYKRNEFWQNYPIWYDFNVLGEAKDQLAIAYNEVTNKIYMASFGAGLVEIDRATGGAMLYDDTNSTIDNFVGFNSIVRLSDVDVDDEGNTWFINHGADKQFGVYTNQQEWYAFDIPVSFLLGHLTLDSYGNAWLTTIKQDGLVVINVEDISTVGNQYKLYSTGNSLLPDNGVNCVTEDLDGEIWVGTDKGIAVFNCGDWFASNCIGNKPIIEQNNQNAFLFSELQVRHIVTDGANRKWVGTNNGVYLISETGKEELLHFDKDNSPLVSNIITALAFDPKTGELFIGTDAGLLAYQTDATVGGIIHNANVKIFPNPVHPEQFGEAIAIDGLPREADVRITTINGNVVYETEANGGRAIWYGYDLDGNAVPTGVYLVFSTSVRNLENPDGHVGKIAIVR